MDTAALTMEFRMIYARHILQTQQRDSELPNYDEPFPQAFFPPQPPSSKDNMMIASRWTANDLLRASENHPPTTTTRASRRQSSILQLPATHRAGVKETLSGMEISLERPTEGSGLRRMRRSRHRVVLNSLYPVLLPTVPLCAAPDSAKSTDRSTAAATSPSGFACLERSARVVLQLSPEGTDWQSWASPCFRGDIDLLKCFVEGQSIHEHLLKVHPLQPVAATTCTLHACVSPVTCEVSMFATACVQLS